MNDLALQIGIVHYIEVHQGQRSYAGRAQIKRQRRAQPTRADAQYSRRLQLELPFHADFRHDQVARVAQDFVVRKRRGFGFDFRDGRHWDLNYDLLITIEEVIRPLGRAPCD